MEDDFAMDLRVLLCRQAKIWAGVAKIREERGKRPRGGKEDGGGGKKKTPAAAKKTPAGRRQQRPSENAVAQRRRRPGVVRSARERKGAKGKHGLICEHGRQRRFCKDCGGSGLCEQHLRRRDRCKDCGGRERHLRARALAL